MNKYILVLALITFSVFRASASEETPGDQFHKTERFEESVNFFSQKSIYKHVDVEIRNSSGVEVKKNINVLDVLFVKGKEVVSTFADCLPLVEDESVQRCEVILNFKDSGKRTLSYFHKLNESGKPSELINNLINIIDE